MNTKGNTDHADQRATVATKENVPVMQISKVAFGTKLAMWRLGCSEGKLFIITYIIRVDRFI